jgi:hypothetical protein
LVERRQHPIAVATGGWVENGLVRQGGQKIPIVAHPVK